jgi:oxygen-independent coproporphyrinogen-3 oxidase
MKPLGIYIHIPFCVRKCRYCDFLSFSDISELSIGQYTAQLISELVDRSKVYGNKYDVDTIFIGGGTPTLLRPSQIDDILDALYARYRITDDAEITIEANPGTVSQYDLIDLHRAGVNRISFGVQSFNDKKLRYLGRIHSADAAVKSIYSARRARFKNINIDLIFGVPGETRALWAEDIETAVELSPEHISFYDLQIEEGTPVCDDIVSGSVAEVSEIEDRLMYHDAIKKLTKAGYMHYEISNAARQGHQSRHNLKYWSMQDYIGLGLGAHSYTAGRRFSNTEDLSVYLAADSSAGMTYETYNNKRSDEISEFIFLGLRRTSGISLSAFRERFGVEFDSLFADETRSLIERKLLQRSGDVLKLTQLGLDLSNVVFLEYV